MKTMWWIGGVGGLLEAIFDPEKGRNLVPQPCFIHPKEQIEIQQETPGKVGLEPGCAVGLAKRGSVEADVGKGSARGACRGCEGRPDQARGIDDALPEKIKGETEPVIDTDVDSGHVQQLIRQVLFSPRAHISREKAITVPLVTEVNVRGKPLVDE